MRNRELTSFLVIDWHFNPHWAVVYKPTTLSTFPGSEDPQIQPKYRLKHLYLGLGTVLIETLEEELPKSGGISADFRCPMEWSVRKQSECKGRLCHTQQVVGL